MSAAATGVAGPSRAQEEKPFTPQSFQSAQKQNRPILVEIHEPGWPICKAQQPILAELPSHSKFATMAVLRVDFDAQKDVVRQFGAQMRSTFIVYRGSKEVGRSVGETKRDAIAELLTRAI
jgi:thioredoxin-like negative regulator of GroEL